MRKPGEAGIQQRGAGAWGTVGPGEVTWQGKANAVLKPRQRGSSGDATAGFSLGSENPNTLRKRVNLSFSPPSPVRTLAPAKLPKQEKNLCYHPHTSQG